MASGGPRDSCGYVALLRGINVGGRNMLPMGVLVHMFADAGCAEVRSYIQSGNVLFAASRACAKRLETLIPEKVSERFGFRPVLVLRTADALARVVAANPFLGPGTDTRFLHVGFLSDAPQPAKIKLLDANRSPPDRFEVRGQEIYLNLPNGMGRTKLSNAYFDAKLATASTFRNWRTVLKLVELSK